MEHGVGSYWTMELYDQPTEERIPLPQKGDELEHQLAELPAFSCALKAESLPAETCRQGLPTLADYREEVEIATKDPIDERTDIFDVHCMLPHPEKAF